VELLFEVFAQLFGEVCCQGLVSVAIDIIAGLAGYKGLHSAEPQSPQARRWLLAFWLLLPVAIALTVFVLIRVVAR
jgi:hypothetical protein